jgi:hypothetical protein
MTVRMNSDGGKADDKAAIGYVSVSTEGQATEGVSMDAQQAKIHAWCLANDVEFGSFFIDAGLSGKRAGKGSSCTWAEFRESYLLLHASSLASETESKINIVLTSFEMTIGAHRLGAVTSQHVSK